MSPFYRLPLLSTAIIALFSTIIYRLFFHPLAKVPGPKLAGLTKLWLAYQMRKGTSNVWQPNLHRKYGPLVRIAPGEVLVSGSADVKALYGAGSPFVKGPWYAVCAAPDSRLKGNDRFDLLTEMDKDRFVSIVKFRSAEIEICGLATSPYSKMFANSDVVSNNSVAERGGYRHQRRAIGPAYSIAGVEKHERLINSYLDTYMMRLRDLNGKWVDLSDWMHIYALDVLSLVTLSKNPGYAELGSDGGNMMASDRHWAYFTVIGIFPWIVRFTQYIPKLNNYLMIPVSLAFGLRIPTGLPIFGFAVPHIMARLAKTDSTKSARVPADRPGLETQTAAEASKEWREGNLSTWYGDISTSNPETSGDGEEEEEEDLLASLIHSHASKTEKFPPSWVLHIALTNFGAGHDTITITLSAIFYHLTSNPSKLHRLEKELREQDVGRETSYTEIARRVPYVLAVVKESMRLTPAIGIHLQRVVPEQGYLTNGYKLPAGTRVGVNPWALHYDPTIFPNPESFEPERWIGDGTEEGKSRIGKMEQCWLGFGGGSRSCPGQYLARILVVRLLARVLGVGGFEVECKGEMEVKGWFSAHLHGVEVRFVKRT